MLAAFTLTLNDQMLPAIVSCMLLGIPMVACRRGIASVIAHLTYFGRLQFKSVRLQAKPLTSLWSVCGAAAISLGNYLPTYVQTAAEKPFPLAFVVGVIAPLLVATITTIVVAGATSSGNETYGMSNKDCERAKAVREWKIAYGEKSKYINRD